MKMATKPLKPAVIAPSGLALLYPFDGEAKGETREQFLSDGSPDVARDLAFQTITSRIEGTATASEKLGLA